MPPPTLPPTPLGALLRGQPRPFTRAGTHSALDQRASVDGPVQLGPEGLEGDAVGDRRVHGGPDKAVHHYPFEHYAAWRTELGPLPRLAHPGAFGENLSTVGLDESSVCLGDRFSLGTALLEVSQGRMPCWKLDDAFGVPGLARAVQRTGRTGWYYRVISPGVVAAGDALTLRHRPHAGWPLARLSALLYAPCLDAAELKAARALPLVPSWKSLIERRLTSGVCEDWRSRLDGP